MKTEIEIRNWIMIQKEIMTIPIGNEVFPPSEIDSCFFANANMKVQLLDSARKLEEVRRE